MANIEAMTVEAESFESLAHAYDRTTQNPTADHNIQQAERGDSTPNSTPDSESASFLTMSFMTSCQTTPLLSGTKASMKSLPALWPAISFATLEKPSAEGMFVSYGTIDASIEPLDKIVVQKLKQAGAKVPHDLEANHSQDAVPTLSAHKRFLKWVFVKTEDRPWSTADAFLFGLTFCLFLAALVWAWLSLPPWARKCLVSTFPGHEHICGRGGEGRVAGA